MRCMDIRKKLDAWIDGELPLQEAENVARHVETCAACRCQADTIRQLVMSLENLPLVKSPPGLAGSTTRLFKKKIEKQDFSEWWKSLGGSFKGAVCGAAMAGLLFGAVLGSNVALSSTRTVTNPYTSLYASQEYMP